VTDVLVIFPPDKKAAAEQLAQASRDSGYEAALAEVGTDGAGIAERARAVPAALLVWSRPLVSSAMLGDWLAGVRQLPNLIEVSTDGIEPETGDSGRVVLLSGWRGQPHHLGWQRIVEALKRLHAPRPARPAAQRTPTAESGARPKREESSALPAGRSLRAGLAALAAAAALAAVGALTWNGSSGPRPEPERRAVAAAAPSGEADGPRIEPAAPKPAAAPPSPPSPPAPATAPAGPEERTATARTAPAREARRPARPSPSRIRAAAAPVKRYSRRHSKTMRLFCARSGRSTPECRTYLRSVRADRD
jgi:hypothetical protein